MPRLISDPTTAYLHIDVAKCAVSPELRHGKPPVMETCNVLGHLRSLQFTNTV